MVFCIECLRTTSFTVGEARLVEGVYNDDGEI